MKGLRISKLALPRMSTPSHRNTIFVEEAEVLSHDAYADAQYVLRIHAHALKGGPVGDRVTSRW